MVQALPRVAIVSALPEELAAVLAHTQVDRVVTLGQRQFHEGQLQGQAVVLVLSGIGKVAAALTATLLAQRGDVSALLFTGVAGGLGPGVRVGDVVVARELLQHDMDPRPLFPRWEVPLTGCARWPTDPAWTQRLVEASQSLGSATPPQVHEGLIVSGDQFVGSATHSRALQQDLPDALAVEMEGAAMAQVCAAFGLPLAVVRTISDRADDSAHVDFQRFLAEVAVAHSRDVILRALWGLRQTPS